MTKTEKIIFNRFIAFLTDYFKFGESIILRRDRLEFILQDHHSHTYEKFVSTFRFSKNAAYSRFIKKYFKDDVSPKFFITEAMFIFALNPDTAPFAKDNSQEKINIILIKKSEDLSKYLAAELDAQKISSSLPAPTADSAKFKI